MPGRAESSADSDAGMFDEFAEGHFNDDEGEGPDFIDEEENPDVLEDEDGISSPNEDAYRSDDLADNEGEEEDDGEEESEEEVEEEEEEPEKKPLSRAEKRIQKAIERQNVAEKKLADMEQRSIQQTQYLLQQQEAKHEAQMKQVSEMLEVQKEQLRLLTSGRKQEEEEANLSEVDRMMLQWKRQAKDEAKQEMTSELSEVKTELAAFKKAAQEEAAAQQSQARLNSFVAEAQRARKEILLKDWDVEDTQEFGESIDDMLIAYIASHDVPPAQAAADFRKTLEKLYSAQMKGRSKKGGEKIRKSKGLPPSAPSGRRPGKGEKRPSWDALQQAGYADYLEWTNAGRPALGK